MNGKRDYRAFFRAYGEEVGIIPALSLHRWFHQVVMESAVGGTAYVVRVIPFSMEWSFPFFLLALPSARIYIST